MPVADTTQFRSYAVDFGIAECSEGGRHYWKVAADTADYAVTCSAALLPVSLSRSAAGWLPSAARFPGHV